MPRRFLALALAFGALVSRPANAHGYLEELPSVDLGKEAPARKYANLAPWQCRQRVAALKLRAKPAPGASLGIATPVRLSGPLRGVTFVTPGGKSPYGKLDCRLVLALDTMAEALAAQGVTRVRIDNLYRPRAHLPGKKNKRSQHAYGLAADVTEFVLADGTVLNVERDWHGAIGSPSCGPGSVLREPSEPATRLRNLFCEIVRRGIFHHHLSPSHDAAHRDHLHLDIQRGKTRRLVK